jgi:hypothetical protein
MDDSGKVLATGRNSSYYSDKVGESTSTHGAIGLAMADAALEKLNPQADNLKKPGTNALGIVLDQLDEYVTAAIQRQLMN